MANYTPNYHLYLPNRNDPEQVDTTLSANFETIDTQIKDRANEIEAHKNSTAAHSSDHITHGDGTVQDTLFDLNKDISDTTERLELIIGDNGNSNAEIVDARGGYPLLRDRLSNADDIVDAIKEKVGINIGLPPYNLSDGSSDFSAIFNQALKDVSDKGGGIIIIPNGTFYAMDYLKHKSYCHVYLSPHTTIIQRTNLYSLWINGEPGVTYSEYGAEHDFSITGKGSILINENINTDFRGSAFGFADGFNILVEDITVRHVMYSHGFDLNGCKNVKIKNVKFLGFYDNSPDKSRGMSDCIQVANMVRPGFSLFGSFQGAPCTELTVEGCTFDKSDIDSNFVAWGVGVGNHGLAVSGRECNKIYIKNNRFIGCTFAAIRMWGWSSVYVTDLNYFENCLSDISMSNVATYLGDGVTLSGSDKGCDNIVINNMITYGCKNIVFGIYVGTKNVYNTNISISNIEIRNAGTGTQGLQVSANYVKDLLIDNLRAFNLNNVSNMMYIQNSIGIMLNNIIGRGTRANIVTSNNNTGVTKGIILLDGTNG